MIKIGQLMTIVKSAMLLLQQISDGVKVIRTGAGFGDLHQDVELKADIVLGEFFLNAFMALPKVGSVTVEGLGDYPNGNGEFWITVDPLDGSLNYKTKGATLGLPYTSCITVLRRKPASFSDVATAVILDLRTGDYWSAYQTKGRRRTRVNGQVSATAADRQLDISRQIVIGEFYYPENREKLARAFAGQKGWLRNPGSAAYEMALVASGQAAAFICDRQKQHELGAGYALVKGAGGVAVDWEGHDLGKRDYDFKSQTPVILAANQSVANHVLELLHR